ncbi:hypothetical protein MNB_SV-6-522 [hydrothermal vent metagenome]|uniref:DAGKc domain-containing protein n=1 Tax=hydrothermal vent metagenome TaxID=652676 RepID=A0A1W1CAZ4_9ZZZZ
MILSIGKDITHSKIDIKSIKASDISQEHDIESYEYIIINGGDGMIRRVLNQLHTLTKPPKFILNPIGSFNVVAKIHRVKSIDTILEKIANNETLSMEKHHIFRLNNELFLFSAGNMGDAQHIFISETLRFGWLKHGMSKYIVAALFLFPIHLLLTPFMLMSRERFFIFTPFGFIKKFGSFYGKVEEIEIKMSGDYNIIELDGDLVTIESSHIHIQKAGYISIVVG